MTTYYYFIHTQSLDIQVLGTSFNVKAFEGADETVALVSGKVKVKPQKDDVEAIQNKHH